MMDPTTSLLIVESGVRHSTWTQAAMLLGPSLVAVIQQHGEPPKDFAIRVAQRVDRLMGQAVRIRRWALLGRDDCPPPSLVARRHILRMMQSSPERVRVDLKPPVTCNPLNPVGPGQAAA
jgi:hypothetical protein